MDTTTKELFNSWVEAYLVSLRFLEKVRKENNISSDKAQELENHLQHLF
jgi:hypothetical protein